MVFQAFGRGILAGELVVCFSHVVACKDLLYFQGCNFTVRCGKSACHYTVSVGFGSGVWVHICPRAKIILDFACYVC